MSDQPTIPRSVIERDHKLEGAADRSTLDLAKHRWEQTLDPNGPQHSLRTYAEAIGRSHMNVSNYARGYASFIERSVKPGLYTEGFTIHDAIRLAQHSDESKAFVEAIAEGSGEPIARIARGDNKARRDITDAAKQRAERKGTNAIDEARKIAEQRRKMTDRTHHRREQVKSARTLRYVEIEGDLAYAQRKLVHALTVAEGVGFNDDEMELLRDSIAKVRSVLNLIDLRMAGTPDIDWDAELANLGGAS